MRKYVEVFTRDHLPKLRDQLLFSGLTDHEIFMFIQYARPYYLSLNRGETARVENKFSHMTGLVFSGTAYLYSVDYNGNKSLLNMLASQRQVFLQISEHLACLSKRSIKGKFMHLLQIYCRRERSCEVDLPFSRDELANYLAVDRASLSRALGELKKAGIIEFKKSHFKLIETAEYHFD